MVRVGFGRSERVEQTAEAPVVASLEANGEMRSAERREQVEATADELRHGGQVDHAVGGEPPEQSVERCRSDVVERAEHGDAPQRSTVEHVEVVRCACSRRRSIEVGPPRTTTTASVGGNSWRRNGRSSWRSDRPVTIKGDRRGCGRRRPTPPASPRGLLRLQIRIVSDDLGDGPVVGAAVDPVGKRSASRRREALRRGRPRAIEEFTPLTSHPPGALDHRLELRIERQLRGPGDNGNGTSAE